MSEVMPDTLEMLQQRARQAQAHAYCPYSHFPVGAAVLTASGEIFTGCNIENAAYPSGICAERVALSTAIAAGHREFLAIAISGVPGVPCMPCGACRQFLAEFCKDTFLILLAGQTYTFGQLLPGRFDFS